MPTHAPSRRHVEAFAEGLARREERCALRWNGAAWTYGALAAGARSGAAWLRARGLGPGDRVACLAGPCPDVVVWMLASYELGAVWVPGFMRQLDAAFEAFARHEERLRALALRPSEYVSRQVRVTPYPTEPTGWIIEHAGPEICMFSSDYPHVEGGRNPLKRFQGATAATPAAALERFYRTNFEDLMGPQLARA